MMCGVWITAGSAHEPASLAGATHLVEHLTLRRCGDSDRRSLARLVDRLGGEVDAWTAVESMGVTVSTTVDALDEGLGLLVDAVLRPTFAADDVELERRIALAELELIRDDPAERVEEAILQAAWGKHPLARSVIGTARTLARLTPEALERHHRRLVRPGRLLAAVAGDVDAREVAERLSDLPLGLAPEAEPLPPLDWSPRHLSVRRQGIDQAHARLAFPAVPAAAPEAVTLGVLNRILGVGASSWLFQRVREDEGLTYDIWSAPVLRRAGGLLEIGWACAPEVFDDISRLVLEELARLPEDLDDDEVAVAKEGLARVLAIDAEQPAACCAMDVAEILDRDRRFDLATAAAEIDAVTTPAVRAVARQVLDRGRMASAVGGPRGLSVRVA